MVIGVENVLMVVVKAMVEMVFLIERMELLVIFMVVVELVVGLMVMLLKYLFEGQNYTDREREKREVFYLVIHSPNGHNDQT